MFPYNRYLISDISTNLTLYYLVTISIFITNILIIFTTLISLFLYSFSNSFASDLSDKKMEIDSFIVFTVWDIPSIRLISVFNSNIRSAFGILSDPPYLININLFEISAFFTSFLFIVLSFFIPFFISFSLIRVYILLLFIYSLLIL